MVEVENTKGTSIALGGSPPSALPTPLCENLQDTACEYSGTRCINTQARQQSRAWGSGELLEVGLRTQLARRALFFLSTPPGGKKQPLLRPHHFTTSPPPTLRHSFLPSSPHLEKSSARRFLSSFLSFKFSSSFLPLSRILISTTCFDTVSNSRHPDQKSCYNTYPVDILSPRKPTLPGLSGRPRSLCVIHRINRKPLLSKFSREAESHPSP